MCFQCTASYMAGIKQSCGSGVTPCARGREVHAATWPPRAASTSDSTSQRTGTRPDPPMCEQPLSRAGRGNYSPFFVFTSFFPPLPPCLPSSPLPPSSSASSAARAQRRGSRLFSLAFLRGSNEEEASVWDAGTAACLLVGYHLPLCGSPGKLNYRGIVGLLAYWALGCEKVGSNNSPGDI